MRKTIADEEQRNKPQPKPMSPPKPQQNHPPQQQSHKEP